MVEMINTNNPNPYGSINRIGTTENGRAIYQILDEKGKEAAKMSLPETECDKFEKSYNTIIETAPKIQRYAQKHSSPEEIAKKRKTSNWIMALSTIAGVAIPMMTLRGSKWKTIPLTIAGLVAGLAGGIGISTAVTSAPGTMKFAKAVKRLSKLDVQPIVDQPQTLHKA